MRARHGLPAERHAFRPEIEGLRAVAALLVAVFHIWVGRVSGGVDVFFVVSGLLITTTLLGHLERYGRVRPLAFIGRLLRRLLPSALVVLVAVLIATWLVVPEALRARAFHEVTASALYFENWQLAVSAVDYLDAADPHTPVQHFWAMSAQGQFYLLWAALLLLSGVVAGLVRRRARTVAVVLIAIVVLLSFGFSVWWTAVNQPYAYFDTFARVWEFGAGALAAFVLTRIRVPRALAAVLGWIGLVAILLCGVLLPVADAFPGAVALWPVAAALFILVSGEGRDRPGQVAWLLSRRPMVRLGGLAYGLYLWHWPLLVLVRHLQEREETGPLTGVAIIISALLLSWLTTRFVERPLRGWMERGAAPRRAGTAVLVVAAMLVAGAGLGSAALTALRAEAQQQRIEAELGAGGDCWGAAAMLVGPGACESDPEQLVPARSALLQDVGDAYQCFTEAGETEVRTCSIGSSRADALRIALVGNSHAAMMIPALEDELEARNWRVDSYVGNGCVWGLGLPRGACPERYEQLDDALLRGEPYDVLLATTGNAGLEALPEQISSVREKWAEIEERGTRVVVVADNPRLSDEVADCVVRSSTAELVAGGCTMAEAEAFPHGDPFVTAAAGTDASVIDLRSFYCSGGECPTVIGNVIVYRDEHHLTATFARTLGPFIAQRLEAAIGADDGAASDGRA